MMALLEMGYWQEPGWASSVAGGAPLCERASDLSRLLYSWTVCPGRRRPAARLAPGASAAGSSWGVGGMRPGMAGLMTNCCGSWPVAMVKSFPACTAIERREMRAQAFWFVCL